MRRRPMHAKQHVRHRRPGDLTRAALVVVAAAAMSIGVAGAGAATPIITYTIDGIAGNHGWYRGSSYGDLVVVRWTINAQVLDDCPHAMTVAGPTTGATRTCTVKLTTGETVSKTTDPIKIDAEPPTGITPSLSRGADYNGWFNHPVNATWSANDATSGIAACTSGTYAGPDGPSSTLSGTCTDNAGNSTSGSIAIAYDATPPALAKVAVVSKTESNVLTWASSSAADVVSVERRARGHKAQAAVFRGAATSFADRKIAPGVEYENALQSVDQAGNVSKRVVVAGLPKVLTLRKLPYVPRAASRPILRWERVRGARYYHVQLFRGSKRVLAAWPLRNALGLPAKWRWAGKRHRLSPGLYRWYVWAGVGRRSFAQYKTIGSAKFVVPR